MRDSVTFAIIKGRATAFQDYSKAAPKPLMPAGDSLPGTPHPPPTHRAGPIPKLTKLGETKGLELGLFEAIWRGRRQFVRDSTEAMIEEIGVFC